MKVSFNWLKEYCKFDLSPEQAAGRLTMAGAEVEEITPVGDDYCFDIEVTSNRPDLLSHIGVARELAALTGIPLDLPSVEYESDPESVEDITEVTVEDPDLCPRYTARVIRGVKIGPAPAWMTARLEAIGLRPVNNVVDITNYVLMETGQPLHAFDMNRLEGPKIIVRRARSGEPITAIDGSRHELTNDMLVIADAKRPVAVAGVMGGIDSEVGDSTVDILLESALFDPPNNRRTSRKLKLESDSSYRFERGVDPDLADWASRRATALIQQLAGGEVAEGVIDVRVAPYEPKTVTMRIDRFNLLIGAEITEDESARILSALGFEIKEQSGGKLTVAVPSFRANDVYREVDLIEEVARVHGYDRIPETTTMPIALSKKSRQEIVEDLTRQVMVGMGYSEAVSFAITDPKRAEQLCLWSDAPGLAIANPMVRDYSVMRRSLLPGLLQIKQTNERQGVRQCSLFELSQVYLSKAGEKLPEERSCLALISDGELRDVKGAVEEILEQVGLLDSCTFGPTGVDFFDPNSRLQMELNGQIVGYLGRISKTVAADFDLAAPCCTAELDFNTLAAQASLDRKYAKLPTYPAVDRDLAIIVDEAVTWADVRDAISGMEIGLLTSIDFFDLYRGKPVPEGRKSVAFSLTFRSDERTLTGEEVNKSVESIVSLLKDRFSAELRTA
ncbi:MAG: phenylalanine--tRNA ligase subunit beta [Planctomycetes bacterium]|nr:phenylalanine--tRNA ligase subunit beta [Planctomycetota bacterium]